MDKVVKPRRVSTSLDGGEQVRFDHRGRRTDCVDVALVELAEPAARRPIGPPHRLNLIALEELRQLALVLRHHTRQRHRQVVPQREIGFALASCSPRFRILKMSLIAFFAVLPHQRLDVLERRGFERFEAVTLVHVADDAQSRGRGVACRREENRACHAPAGSRSWGDVCAPGATRAQRAPCSRAGIGTYSSA